MGNKFTRRRPVVDERYTRTQGLYQHRDLDPRKLRKLILNGHLAPCFPGVEESSPELDECPICFLFYPSLNRSKCCTKGICTECFLQIKSPHLARPPQCPFCKTSSYMVEYRGAKSVEEKGVEQAEEQKVIEAKIRIRQKELEDEKERMCHREEGTVLDTADNSRPNFSNFNGFTATIGSEGCLAGVCSSGQSEPPLEPVGTLQTAASGRSRPTSFNRSNRDNEFELDLEDIMVMEAIWLSIQEQGQPQQVLTIAQQRLLESSSEGVSENRNADTSTIAGQDSNEPRNITGGSSVTGGLAGAIAALAERQIGAITTTSGQASDQNNIENASNSVRSDNNNGPTASIVPSNMTLRRHLQRSTEEQNEGMLNPCPSQNGGQELRTWIEDSVDNGRSLSPLLHRESRGSDWLLDQSSEAVEVGTSFSSSVPSASELPWEAPDYSAPQAADAPSDLPVLNPSPLLPESYEEQIMLAMALSLADAQSQARGL